MVYNNVMEYCCNHYLSIYAFDHSCGIGIATVSKWKEKNFDPSIPTLQKIANATGVPKAEWLKE